MVHSVSTWVQQRYLWLICGPLSLSFEGRDYRLSPENAVEPSSPLFLGSYEVRLLLLGRESLEGLKGVQMATTMRDASLMTLKGVNGQLDIFENKLTIRRSGMMAK